MRISVLPANNAGLTNLMADLEVYKNLSPEKGKGV